MVGEAAAEERARQAEEGAKEQTRHAPPPVRLLRSLLRCPPRRKRKRAAARKQQWPPMACSRRACKLQAAQRCGCRLCASLVKARHASPRQLSRCSHFLKSPSPSKTTSRLSSMQWTPAVHRFSGSREDGMRGGASACWCFRVSLLTQRHAGALPACAHLPCNNRLQPNTVAKRSLRGAVRHEVGRMRRLATRALQSGLNCDLCM